MGDAPFLVITLYPRESACIACGVPLSDCRQGIPFYEDQALPSTWEGGDGKDWPEGWGKEHGGHDACEPCFRAQSVITEPTPLRELARLAGCDTAPEETLSEALARFLAETAGCKVHRG